MTTMDSLPAGRRRRTPMVLRVFEGHARTYKHTWRGSVFTAFLTPLLYLLAMGYGLGSLVQDGAVAADDYVSFLAPALLVASAFQVGAGEGAFPVMAGFKWLKTYDAMLATPVTPRDVVTGHVAWASVRILMTAIAFAVVATALGALPTPGAAALLVPVGLLTALAFLPWIMAYTSRLGDDSGIAQLFRFGVVPVFLFSGTFFPVEQLPSWLEPVTRIIPLWHGVEIARDIADISTTPWPIAAHLGVLVAWFAIGMLVAVRAFERKLVQ